MRHKGMVGGVVAGFLFALTAPAAEPMWIGVDDAGRKKPIFDDPVMTAAFLDMGLDFIMFHVWNSSDVATVDRLDQWCERHGVRFYLNQENADKTPGDPGVFRRPGRFFQPSPEVVRRCLASPRFLGICYDEAEHWILNGVNVTAGKDAMTDFTPHFYDAAGGDLEEAYEGNLYNVRALMDGRYQDFARSARPGGPVICTEHVFPALFHLFARAGVSPFPKYLKESVTPVMAALAMGAAKQYGTRVVPCVDLWWSPGTGIWPGHTPEEVESALLFAYGTGSPAAYVENLSHRDALYRPCADGAHELTPWGEAVKRFKRVTMRTLPPPPRMETFAPEIVMVRFPDSDFGQKRRGRYMRGDLYGTSDIQSDERTRAWFGAWHLLSHGAIPATGPTWHAGWRFPFRMFFPMNNVAVYDHTAADPTLYEHARLIILCGVNVTPAAMATIRRCTEAGAIAVTPPWLAPADIALAGAPFRETAAGKGAWIVTDDFTHPALRARLAPLLGRPDEMRYVFDRTEIIFRRAGTGLTMTSGTRP